ncbi:hypothetical protein FFI89_031570 [Bradyrhizobium sp. KBS0727]|nr:hypothetical protein FFI71_031575 [Bradyrhizobium sp. KBS0725]QDW47872.1 hypothetical protein FFI89_031570 [Bradyrhizobium sp. KBS0727]
MRNDSQFRWNAPATRCAVCEGRFGLVRHYSWRTALCSRKCADRFRTRREGDCTWLRASHGNFPMFGTPEPRDRKVNRPSWSLLSNFFWESAT